MTSIIDIELNMNDNSNPTPTITFDMLQSLKQEHIKMYNTTTGTSTSVENNELLNYLYDILDNINSEIIKQNKQRIKAKYGSLLPPQAVRTKQSANQDLIVDAERNDADGFQQVMPKRSVRPSGNNNSGKRGNYRDGKTSTRPSNGASGGKSSYSQPYRPESERNTYKSNGYQSKSSESNKSGSSVVPGVSGGGVLSRLLGTDRVKMGINRELNKLSSANMDVIADSIMDVFATWLLDELNADAPINTIRDKYNNYLHELWTNLVGKSLAQENMSEVYFKFLRLIMNSQFQSGANGRQTLMTTLRAKSPIMAGRLGSWQPGFYELDENKNALIDEVIAFLNSASYFENDINTSGLAVKIGGSEHLMNIQQAFSIIGLFTKYFMDVPTGRNRMAPSSWDIMLLAIYSNFKLINELLYWEPVNLEEVERRVFFTVGFLQDNRAFIQSLDTDFYRDIECELDSIKKCASIPTSVKYKLFDCIDNFILMRKSGTIGRK